MRRRKRSGFKDRFPRLPPGCTPSDVDRAMAGPKCPDCGRREADGHADGCRRADDDYRPCMVCRPPPDASEQVDMASDLSRLPFCDDHDPSDLRAKWERDKERMDEERRAARYRDADDVKEDRMEGDHDGPD